jgi:type IV pilus assembly protein PilY1
MKHAFVLKPLSLAVAGVFLVVPLTASSQTCSGTDNTTCTSSLTNSPLPVTSSALPNIMLIIDNSGSMRTEVPNSEGKSRMTVAKEAANQLIGGLDGVRTGLFSFTENDGGQLFEIMGDLDATKKTAMQNKISALNAENWTPLAETLSGVGRYYSTGATGNLQPHPGWTTPPAKQSRTDLFNSYTNSSNQTVVNPIQYWCQKSFTILLTDGLPTYDQSVSDGLKEYYGYCSDPANAANCQGSFGLRNYQLAQVTKGPWDTSKPERNSNFFYSGENYPSDYLDDVANALYDIDLRPDLTPPSPATKSTKNNVTTYTIAFADPTLDQTTLLERAAAYGGGLYFNAGDSAALTNALNKIKDDLIAKDGAAAAVAVANAQVTNTDNASYVTSYNSGNWTGDLIAYPINIITGSPDVLDPIWKSTTLNIDPTACTSAFDTKPVDPYETPTAANPGKGFIGCSAQVQLNTRLPSNRIIVTSSDNCQTNCGIPFTTATGGLTATQQVRLRTPGSGTGTDPGDAANVVSYLRGDRSNEGTTYRTRAHVLGDTVNAEPLTITEPNNAYSDDGYRTDYPCPLSTSTTKCTAFRTANDTRARVVVQPANDGMVHVFNALTGKEEWAYVPGFLINSESDPGNSGTALLNTRTRIANFSHYYMIDATPVAGDVDFDKAGTATATTGVPNWRTIVVGGLGKGGRGFYALDMTNPLASDEAAAKSKILWEFPDSISDATARAAAKANMGYAFGKPIITKTDAHGWVVLVTAGYNNGADTSQTSLNGATITTDGGGDGYGHLYVINPKTGDLIKDIPTPICNTAVSASLTNSRLYPCGLAHINGYVEDRLLNNTTTYVYGGDLYGNVWRFNLTGTASSTWSVAKLAVLRSGNTASSPVQPITSVPELSAITSGTATMYYVYVGTGQYLDKNDLPCPSTGTCAWTANSRVSQTQSMYGLIDPRTSASTPVLPDPLRAGSNLQTQTITVNAGNSSLRNITTNTLSASAKGWVLDFTGGERIYTDPAAAAGTLAFTTNKPSTEICSSGGSSWLYAVNFETGGQVPGSSWGGKFVANALSSRPVLIQLPNGKLYALIRTSEGITVSQEVPVAATPEAARRVSWKELLDK